MRGSKKVLDTGEGVWYNVGSFRGEWYEVESQWRDIHR